MEILPDSKGEMQSAQDEIKKRFCNLQTDSETLLVGIMSRRFTWATDKQVRLPRREIQQRVGRLVFFSLAIFFISAVTEVARGLR